MRRTLNLEAVFGSKTFLTSLVRAVTELPTVPDFTTKVLGTFEPEGSAEASVGLTCEFAFRARVSFEI